MKVSDYNNQVQTIFIALLDRPATEDGLDYYTELLYENGGKVGWLVHDIYISDEFKKLFHGKSLEQQINQVYQNSFDRDAENEGLSYWSDQVRSGNITLSELPVFITSYAGADDKSILDGKVKMAFNENVKALVVENVGSDHIENVTDALTELGSESMSVDQADIDFNNAETYRKATREAAGEYDVMNWSFTVGWRDGSNYIYDHAIRDAFQEGSAVTVAAGNSGQFDVRETQRSPFDFTAGSIKTFSWDSDNVVDGRATRDAKWDVAWFTNENPQFVDFYTYGDYGTSFAAPRLGSYISLIREDNPNASLSSIRTVLEKNSDYQEIDTDEGSWFIQVLDPYDLKNNTVRDGKIGNKTQIFSDAVPESEYDFDFILDDTIDTRVRTEALYEVYLNRNPDPDGLDWWVNEIEENDLNFEDLANVFSNAEDEYESLPEDNEYTVPLIEKVQGLYHVHLGRESTDEEVLNHIDYIGETGISWNNFVDEWKDDTLYV